MEQHINQNNQKINKMEKNCETCTLQLYFPARWLIRVRAFGFGRGQKKF